jgi:hypothetical protein
MMDVASKAAEYAARWAAKKQGASAEVIQLCEIEVRKAEALQQHMLTLTMDAYSLDATAYLDANFKADTSIETVLGDVAANASPESKVEEAVIEATKEDAPVISIVDADTQIEVETPKISDLSKAVRSLMKKGRFDSAELMATQYLSVGNYIPKKEKQTPDKWSEAKVKSWLKDIQNTLTDEKLDKKENAPVDTKVEETKEVKDENVAANGLTGTELENLRLLNFIIPASIEGHGDYQSRREILNQYLSMGNTLEAENNMLTAISRRIAEGHVNTALPEAELAKLFSDADKFCKVFFAHRAYTEKSVKAWREATMKDILVNHFLYLKTKDEINPEALTISGISLEQLNTRIKELVANDKTLDEVAGLLEEGILYKKVLGKDPNNKDATSIYTKLHAKDLLERVYSVHKTAAPSVDPDLKPILNVVDDKIDVSEIKMLLATIIENGGILVDAQGHPEILGLVGKKIQNGEKNIPLTFGKKEALLSWIKTIFDEVSKKIVAKETPKEEDKKEITVVENNTSLKNMLLLAETAFKNSVPQVDFIKANIDLVKGENNTWKTMTDPADDKGSKTTVKITSEQSFKDWVAEQYIAQEKIKANIPLVNSMKELKTKGHELLSKGTDDATFISWLYTNLFKRKLKEQQVGGEYTTLDAIINFANKTFGKKLPIPADKEVKSEKETKVVGEQPVAGSKLTVEQVHEIVAKHSKEANVAFINLVKELRELYGRNGIVLERKGEVTVGEQVINIADEIIKVSNPEMFKERKERKILQDAARKASPEIEFEADKKAEVTTETTVVEDVVETPADEIVPETIDAEHQVFEKIDIQSVDPSLWETIKNFKTMDEVYNMAVEMNTATPSKFNEALSMCLIIMPTLEGESKDWTPEQITMWFNKTILPANDTVETSEEEEAKAEEVVDAIVIPDDPDYKTLQSAKDGKALKRSISAILQKQEDSKELRNLILTAIKTGNGSHTRQVGKMPDKEIHSMINNVKEKIGKFKKEPVVVEEPELVEA